MSHDLKQQLADHLRLDRAIRFAADAHRRQIRKGSGIPYISHPVAVAMILQKYGYPLDWVIAGLLHDTIEDTDVTLEEIRREFGNTVADIVEGCTEPEHRNRPWEQRKAHTINYLQNAPLAVRVVTSADKLHNLLSILQDRQVQGEEVWRRFHRARDQQEWYYRELMKSLTMNLDPADRPAIFDELEAAIERVFGPQD